MADQQASGFSPALVGTAEFDRQLAHDGGNVIYGLKLNGELVTLPRYRVPGDDETALSHGALNGMVPESEDLLNGAGQALIIKTDHGYVGKWLNVRSGHFKPNAASAAVVEAAFARLGITFEHVYDDWTTPAG